MATVLIQPAGPRDQAMHKDQYEALRAALEAEGYEAAVDIGFERRGVEQVALDLIIHLGGDVLLDAVVAAVKKYLRNFRRPETGEPRAATIYGPRGEVLCVVELEDDPE
jgi:hypothetical protein